MDKTSNHGGAEAESTLAKRDIHEEWRDNYRTPENERFYAMAFGLIVDSFGAAEGALVMDAGCGSCAKSRHLVDQGLQVLGTDLSDEALDMARQAISDTKYEDNIELRQVNLTSISMDDGEIPYIVCWGVLMHIPEVEAAISELSRILKPGGRIAISEGNRGSLQTYAIRFIKWLLRREQRARVDIKQAGTEYWEETDEGQLMTRQADIRWLIDEFGKHGLKLVDRRSGQFTELYWQVSNQTLRKLIHGFNSFWFRWVRWGGPAFGNILVFEKANDGGAK